ncbi:MAG: dephospho-CoA kinase [Candidatus Marinimicrobia bacterium]|nr:dephospho-CoA kinase [Candidatus Neomarinimicrobiota bacterium]
MITLGITGGIGSGKSTAREIFSDLNTITLDADSIAKQLLITDDKLKKLIKKEFGSEIYNNGKLNKKLLADRAFDSSENQKKLNEIIHPIVRQYILDEFKRYRNKNELIVVEASMLLEANMQNDFDYILVITADKKARLKRIKSRAMNQIAIENIIKLQMPEEEKIKYADFVIKNNKSKEHLNKECKLIIKKLESENEN